MNKFKIKNSALALFSAAVFASAFIFGCSDSVTSTNNTTITDNISVSAMSDDNLTDNSSDSIIIDEAKALINEVEFEQEPSGAEQEVHITPFVVHFDVNGGLTTLITGQVPAGSYNKIKFKIHKPEDNETPSDPEFKEGSSGNQRYSFIVKGRINGTPFVYKSRKTAELVINLTSPVNVNGSGNITLLFNKNFWFRNGNIILDPRNSQNDDMVDDNIRNSFRSAFRDDDKNGQDDN